MSFNQFSLSFLISTCSKSKANILGCENLECWNVLLVIRAIHHILNVEKVAFHMAR